MEVFSSAEITNSAGCRVFPSHRRAYRSKTRPALASKSGSLGKIQLRYVQGLMASSVSHRHTVASETLATMPLRMASSRMSGTPRRDSGRPSVPGSSQARALTSTTTPGGKDPGPSPPGPLRQALQALLQEPLSPLPHHLPAGVGAQGDLLDGDPVGGQENDAGPDDLPIR